MKPKWQQFENSIQKDFLGKKNRGSGNQWFAPGDISVPRLNILIECKQTSKKSFSITNNLWDKIYEEALFSKKIPILAIKLNDVELLVFDKDDAVTLLNHKKPF
jgi:hypothetical protein